VPFVPLTVIVRGVESEPVESVAVRVPAEPVAVPDAASAPDVAEKLTGTPDTTLLFLSVAKAVIVAVVDPSVRIVATLLDKLNCGRPRSL
jgi:hypothetical protein